MLKIGVFGLGHMGKIHVRLLQQLTGCYEITGFYDPSDEAAALAIKLFGIKRFNDPFELMDSVDCVDIVTPTSCHFDIAVNSLKKSKHVFIEKPVTETVEEAKILMRLAAEAGVRVQIGHVERFNPAFTTALPSIERPMFIEAHRLATYNPRGTDVSVVSDLMIHDIDILLSIVKSSVRRVSANGVAVLSHSPDIANARIEFDNGCVANLTASRISQKSMRKMRLFQRNAYISIDFLDRSVEIIHQSSIEPDTLTAHFATGELTNFSFPVNRPLIPDINAVEQELIAFHSAVKNAEIPAVNMEHAFHSMELVHRILDKLKLSTMSSYDNI